jgi:hypothetical protein
MDGAIPRSHPTKENPMMMMTGLAFFLSAASLPGDPVVATHPEVKLVLGTKVKARQIVAHFLP